MNDLIFENHFSIFLIRPVTDAGQSWLDEHISEDAMTLGNAIACEPRYVADIARGAEADGLTITVGSPYVSYGGAR